MSQQEVVQGTARPSLSLSLRQVLRSLSLPLPAMLRRAISTAAPSARVGLARSLAPALSRALRTTGARLADEAASGGGGLTLNFNLPSKSLYSEASVEMVILPGGDGMFGVMPSHVPTITELKPGVVSVQETAGGELSKYFVSGGFASGARTRAQRIARVGRRVGTATRWPVPPPTTSPMRPCPAEAPPRHSLSLRPGAPCPHAQSTRTPCSTSRCWRQ